LRISYAGEVNWIDIIVVFPTEYLQVWLLNKGRGTIFLSWVDLRPLKTTLYQEVNGSQLCLRFTVIVSI
jgi:hypothetical protein